MSSDQKIPIFEMFRWSVIVAEPRKCVKSGPPNSHKALVLALNVSLSLPNGNCTVPCCALCTVRAGIDIRNAC